MKLEMKSQRKKSDKNKYISLSPKVIAVFGICTFSTFILACMFKDSEKKILPSDLKYILVWKPPDSRSNELLKYVNSSYSFQSESCIHKNCYITDQNDLLGHYQSFDAIVFIGSQYSKNTFSFNTFPRVRPLNQTYIFLQLESADEHPICSDIFDDFFNWTMTYTLDSDLSWPYFEVKNANNEVIGPKINMKWEEDEMDIFSNMHEKLQAKTKMAAWFPNGGCKSRSKNLEFVMKLNRELTRLNQSSNTVDIFGKCGTYDACPEKNIEKCNEMLLNDYYFYFAMEDSFSEDYITTKVLNAFKTYTVPVVYGGAKYHKFLPPHSYIDALKLGPEKLAGLMLDIFNNRTLYQEYFKWHNKKYTYHENTLGPMCQLCQMLNEDVGVSYYKNFRYWWNPNYEDRCGFNL